MRTSPVFPAIVAAATIALALVHGCTLPLGGLSPSGAGGGATTSASSAGGARETAAATTSGGGAPTTTSATASSSSTGAPECTTKPDCGPDGKCATHDCVEGKCVPTPINEGMTLPDPNGNCLKTVCVGGELKAQNDDMDFVADGNPCTIEGCSNGAVTHPPGNDGGTCGPPGKHCFNGQCLECGDPMQCPQGANACTVATCVSGLCGLALAPDDTPCADANECSDASTCSAGACVPHPKMNGGGCAIGFGKCVDGGCCGNLLVCGNGNKCCNAGQYCNSGQQCK